MGIFESTKGGRRWSGRELQVATQTSSLILAGDNERQGVGHGEFPRLAWSSPGRVVPALGRGAYVGFADGHLSYHTETYPIKPRVCLPAVSLALTLAS